MLKTFIIVSLIVACAANSVFEATNVSLIDSRCYFNYVAWKDCFDVYSCIDDLCEMSLDKNLSIIFQLVVPIYDCVNPYNIFESTIILAVPDNNCSIVESSICHGMEECVDTMCKYTYSSSSGPMVIKPLNLTYC